MITSIEALRWQRIDWRRSASLLALSTLVWAGAARASEPVPANATNEDGDIIVTAQHRSERLQDVPITITSVNAARMERQAITNVRDLTVATPGLIAQGQGAYILPAIRGVASVQTDPGNDANVALYVDGVYQADQAGNAMDLPDVERIEILKGPQGTLFGRNATGGAIRIFTRQPSLEEAEGMIDLGYGRYNDFTAKGFLTTPLVEGKLAASISGFYERMDSYTFNDASNQPSIDSEGRSVRAKLLAKPTENFEMELFGSYAYRIDGDAAAQTSTGNSIARGIPGAIISTQRDHYSFNGVAEASAKIYTTGLRMTLETEVGDLTSTTAYNRSKSFVLNEGDFSSIDIISYPITKKQRTWSQELLFSSRQFGVVQITAGAFYYDDNARYDPLILHGLAFGGDLFGYMQQKTKALSGFGELTVTPTDRLTLIAGLRYSHERRSAFGGYFPTAGRPTSLPALGVPTSFNATTPRASIRYTFDSGDNVYFTYSKGFKSGGFNISALQAEPFKQEMLDAFELGLKTSPARMLSANIAAFYYSYKDQQQSAVVNNLNITTNAASSRVYGMDAEIIARLSEAFTVNLGLAYLDSKFRTYVDVPGNIPIPGPDPTVPCLCGNMSTILDLSGGRTPFSPKFTFSVNPTYHVDIDAGTIDLSAHLYYSSKYNFQAQPLIQQDDYATLALRASFQPRDSQFTFYVWGKNVTNRRYLITGGSVAGGDYVSLARPATYGGGVKASF